VQRGRGLFLMALPGRGDEEPINVVITCQFMYFCTRKEALLY